MGDKFFLTLLVIFIVGGIGSIVFLFSPKEHFKGKIVEVRSGKNFNYALIESGRIVKYAPGEEGHNMITGVGDSIEGYIQFSGNVTIQKVFHPDTTKVGK